MPLDVIWRGSLDVTAIIAFRLPHGLVLQLLESPFVNRWVEITCCRFGTNHSVGLVEVAFYRTFISASRQCQIAEDRTRFSFTHRRVLSCITVYRGFIIIVIVWSPLLLLAIWDTPSVFRGKRCRMRRSLNLPSLFEFNQLRSFYPASLSPPSTFNLGRRIVTVDFTWIDGYQVSLSSSHSNGVPSRDSFPPSSPGASFPPHLVILVYHFLLAQPRSRGLLQYTGFIIPLAGPSITLLQACWTFVPLAPFH